MVEEYISILANYGFPVFVAAWFMFRTEKIINRNTEAITKLSDIVMHLEDIQQWAKKKTNQ